MGIGVFVLVLLNINIIWQKSLSAPLNYNLKSLNYPNLTHNNAHHYSITTLSPALDR